jgi:hypothetical protein
MNSEDRDVNKEQTLTLNEKNAAEFRVSHGRITSSLSRFRRIPGSRRTDPSSTSGGIQSARGPEHYLLMFAALMRSLRTPRFNIRRVD